MRPATKKFLDFLLFFLALLIAAVSLACVISFYPMGGY